MQYIVPFFSLTGLYWQYGLVLYWVTTNMWTLGQQYFMFRNWEPLTADAPTAGTRAPRPRPRPSNVAADAPGVEIGAPRGPRPAGAAKTAAAGTKTTSGGGATRTASGTGAAKTTSGNGAKTTSGTAAGGAAKATSAGTRTGTGTRDGSRSGTSARANGTPGSSGAAKPGTASGRVQTGNAGRDAAANSPGPANGQNGAAKRGLLRLGKPKPEPEPEPEAPVTKVVRQQPVRQARSKRPGKH
jgi:YidC/Oxa1 family membrane protein insertase